MIRSAGAPGKIIDLVRMGTLSTVVDDRILQEYSEVLKRDYFRRYFTDLEREELLDFLRSNSLDDAALRKCGRILDDDLLCGRGVADVSCGDYVLARGNTPDDKLSAPTILQLSQR